MATGLLQLWQYTCTPNGRFILIIARGSTPDGEKDLCISMMAKKNHGHLGNGLNHWFRILWGKEEL